MEIKPMYITFQQAKLLKEKGFDVRLKKVYNILGELWDSHYQYMENSNPDCGAVCVAPEQWVVVEWLRVKFGILSSTIFINKDFYAYVLHKRKGGWNSKFFKTPQEATSAAIDYVLTNLI